MSSTDAPAPHAASDERIAFRGPLQRLLISPEIGALIGAVMVWTLFWAVGSEFSTASATALWLDSAAPLGIMAVAVALLMIGGEFDLSSGVITGSMGIFVGIFAQRFMGDGASMYLAVPAAFLVAGLIGWLNGTLVVRTGLPSFIVTLATFFVLQGANLVFSKRLVNKVIVENINAERIKDFKPFETVFAGKFKREPPGFADQLFLGLVLLAALLVVFALLEQSLVRRQAAHSRALVPLLGGAFAAAAGLVLLHTTDGVGANWLCSILGLGGAAVGTVGFASWRYETSAPEGAWLAPSVRVPLVGGVGALVAGWAITRKLDMEQRREILSIPSQGVKVAIGVAAAALGFGVALHLGLRRVRNQASGRRQSQFAVPRVVLVALLAGLVSTVGVVALLQLTTEQGFRAGLFVGFGVGGVLAILVAKGRARSRSRRCQLLVGLIAASAVVFLAVLVRYDSGSHRFRGGLVGALAIAAAAIVANALVEAVGIKRHAFDRAADTRGRVVGFIGLLLIFLAFVLRIAFSGSNVRTSILWWLIITGVAAFVLARTRWGNWIFAVGGNKDAARAVGVPVDQVKVGLFMMVSLVGCFVGMLTVLRYNSVPAGSGVGKEFEFIIAAVVGGCLLTGGYGSVIGASFGAMIAAMPVNGINYAGWNSDNKMIFLGVVLFLAVLVNQKIRKKAQEAR